ncbi:hypothetical protein B0T20DRAFT_344218 [Sordaria brevicollis]|uniref:Uncharacterized protein n=1 Tax=Sordaria brevicollis TaxID=83679 RepID=A0AAE0PM14_SORBR|nr:hypothetical protein B0T20DRAFT_344218 [Sordaria brevicollis]
MAQSLRQGNGRHWGVANNYSAVWIAEYRRKLLPWIGKLTDMGTYDCLSLGYRLLWKLKDLPHEPHRDEMRRAMNGPGGANSILLLPQDDEIDFMLCTIIRRRATKGDKWAWEHDLAALNKQVSLLPPPTCTQWFANSRIALRGLGRQREGLTSEAFEPLPGFGYALVLDRGALGVRKGTHCPCCENQANEHLV